MYIHIMFIYYYNVYLSCIYNIIYICIMYMYMYMYIHMNSISMCIYYDVHIRIMSMYNMNSITVVYACTYV